MAKTEPSQSAEDLANISDDDLVYLSNTNVAKKEAMKEAAAGDSQAKIAPGMLPEVKNLYLGKRDANGSFATYTDKYPEDLPPPEENEDTARFALLVRNRICHGRDNGLAISSILVQSPLLKKVLCCVLEDYPGIAPELNDLEFIAPFRPFVHRWQRLTDVLNDERDSETKSHIQVLHDILQEELKLCLEARADFIHHKVVTFKNLWLIFEPGTTILTTVRKRQVAAKLKHSSVYMGKHEDVFHLECECVYFDGETFGWHPTSFDIPEFGGILEIHELPVCPLAYHPKAKEITKRLVADGKKFEQLAGIHHKTYQGVALNGLQPFYVDSRIIIDAKTFVCHNPDQQVRLRPLPRSPAMGGCDSSTSLKFDISSDKDDADDNNDDDDEDKDEDMTKFIPALTEEQLMLCNILVKGYSLRNKRWLHFFVDTIDDIRWKPNAWDDVVMDEGQKDLIYSVINGHRQGRRDLHSGGLNVALSGHTGVGKTFVVESLAEHLHAPLFHVKSADLDVDHSNPDLESPFTDMLEVCSEWNAIILYDHAQNLLHMRDDDESCSIILDSLKTHSAAFFMTSIRPFDEGINPRLQSRFHLRLWLPFPNPKMRSNIWRNCIRDHRDIKWADLIYEDLAQWELNGHEIADAVRTAKTLMKDGLLRMIDVERVLSANLIDFYAKKHGKKLKRVMLNDGPDHRDATQVIEEMSQDEDEKSSVCSWTPHASSKAKQFDPFEDDIFPQAKVDTRQRTLDRLGKTRKKTVDYVDNDCSRVDEVTNAQPAVASDGEEGNPEPSPKSKATNFNISDVSDSTVSNTEKKKTKKGKRAFAGNTDLTPPCEPIPENDDSSGWSFFGTSKKKGYSAEVPPLEMNCRNCPSVSLLQEGRFCTFCGSRAFLPKACGSCAKMCGARARGKSGKCAYCGRQIVSSEAIVEFD